MNLYGAYMFGGGYNIMFADKIHSSNWNNISVMDIMHMPSCIKPGLALTNGVHHH